MPPYRPPAVAPEATEIPPEPRPSESLNWQYAARPQPLRSVIVISPAQPPVGRVCVPVTQFVRLMQVLVDPPVQVPLEQVCPEAQVPQEPVPQELGPQRRLVQLQVVPPEQTPPEHTWPDAQVPHDPAPQELGPQLRPAQVQVVAPHSEESQRQPLAQEVPVGPDAVPPRQRLVALHQPQPAMGVQVPQVPFDPQVVPPPEVTHCPLALQVRPDPQVPHEPAPQLLGPHARPAQVQVVPEEHSLDCHRQPDEHELPVGPDCVPLRHRELAEHHPHPLRAAHVPHDVLVAQPDVGAATHCPLVLQVCVAAH